MTQTRTHMDTHTHAPPKWEKAARLEDALYLCLSTSLALIISLCTVQHPLLLSLPPTLSSITTPQHSSLKCNSSLCLVVQIKPRLFNDLLSGCPWLPRHVSSHSLCVHAKLSEPNFSYFAAKLVSQKSRTASNLLGGNTFCRLLNATFFFFSQRGHTKSCEKEMFDIVMPDWKGVRQKNLSVNSPSRVGSSVMYKQLWVLLLLHGKLVS